MKGTRAWLCASLIALAARSAPAATETEGPKVFAPAGSVSTTRPVGGDWQFVSDASPGAAGEPLLPEELHVSLETPGYSTDTGGGVAAEPGQPPGAVPLPAPLWSGLIGLGVAGVAAWRLRRRRI